MSDVTAHQQTVSHGQLASVRQHLCVKQVLYIYMSLCNKNLPWVVGIFFTRIHCRRPAPLPCESLHPLMLGSLGSLHKRWCELVGKMGRENAIQ